MKLIQWNCEAGKRKRSKNYLITCDWLVGWWSGGWRTVKGVALLLNGDRTFVILPCPAVIIGVLAAYNDCMKVCDQSGDKQTIITPFIVPPQSIGD